MPTTYLESFGADLSENKLFKCVSIILTGMMENYHLEEGIENTEESLGILTEVNQVYDSESMEGRVMRDNWGGDGSGEREEEAKCMVVKYVIKIEQLPNRCNPRITPSPTLKKKEKKRKKC